jgi:hypothetical protein
VGKPSKEHLCRANGSSFEEIPHLVETVDSRKVRIGCPDSYSSMARKCPVNGGVNGKIIKYHQIYQMKWEKK